MEDATLVFHYLHMAGRPGVDRDGGQLEREITERLEKDLGDHLALWGLWRGLFGVGSNERIAVFAGTADEAMSTEVGDLAQQYSTLIEHLVLTPTVRPETVDPCTKEGLYVFRRFVVSECDVDEIATLSALAWTSFETTDSYSALPQGLFRLATSTDPGLMLLVTWYDGLDSWQISRRPPSQAKQNFLRRHALTKATSAIATRLVTVSNSV